MTFNPIQTTTSLSSRINFKPICQQSIDSSSTNICQVCGNKARCFNYGAISCLSCRAFFRRHGFRSKEIRSCPFDEPCEVHVQKQERKACVACRLAKCLAAGMNANFFRQVIEKSQKSSSYKKLIIDRQVNLNHQRYVIIAEGIFSIELPLIEVFFEQYVPQLPTLDLLNHNRSNLTFTDWTLLSNIIHAYDNFSSIPSVTCTIEELSGLPLLELSKMPIMFEISKSILTSLVNLFRSIPDFQILTVTEQRSLLNRNIGGSCCVNFMYVTRQSGCTTSPAFIIDYISLCGSEAFSRVKRFEHQLDSDSTLVKLMLIILAFSANCSVLTLSEPIHHDTLLLGTFRLLGSQNVYVELLWKYMLYRYGYVGTVMRFARLIKQVVDLIDHAAKACTNMNDSRFHVDTIFPEGKRSSMSSSNEDVPLWGYV